MATPLMAPLPPLPKLLPPTKAVTGGFPAPSPSSSHMPRAPVYSQQPYDVKPSCEGDSHSGFPLATGGVGAGGTSREGGSSFVVPPPKKRRRNVSGFLRKPRKSDCRGLVFHAACLGTRSSTKSYWCAECLRAEVPSSDRFVEKSRIVVAVAERFIKTNKMFLGDYRCKRLMIDGRTHYVLASAAQAAEVCDPSFEVEHAAPASMFAFDTNGVAFKRMDFVDADESIVYHWSGKKKQFLAVPKPNSRNPSVRCTRPACPNTGNRLCEHNLCSVHCFELQGITQHGDDRDRDHDHHSDSDQQRRRHKARNIKCSVHLPEKLYKVPVGRKFPTLSQKKGGATEAGSSSSSSSRTPELMPMVDLSSDSQSSTSSFSSSSSSSATSNDGANTSRRSSNSSTIGSRRSSKRRRVNKLPASSSCSSDESQHWSESSGAPLLSPVKSEPFHLSRLMERCPSPNMPAAYHLPPPLSFSNSSSSPSVRPIPATSSSSSLPLPSLPPPLPLPPPLSSSSSPASSPAPPLPRASGALPLALQLPPASLFSPEKTVPTGPSPASTRAPSPASDLPAAPLPLPLPLPRQNTSKRKRPPPLKLPRLPSHSAADTAKRHKAAAASHLPSSSNSNVRREFVLKSPDSDRSLEVTPSHSNSNSSSVKAEPEVALGSFDSGEKTLRAFDFPQTILSARRTPKSFEDDGAPPPMMDDGVVDDDLFEDFMKSLNDPEANAKVLKGREDADLSLLRGPLAALQSPPPPSDNASYTASLLSLKREQSSDSDSAKSNASSLLSLPLTPAVATDSDSSSNADLFSSRPGDRGPSFGLVPASDSDHGSFSAAAESEDGDAKFSAAKDFAKFSAAFRSRSRSSSPPAREFQLLPFHSFEPASPFPSLLCSDHPFSSGMTDVSHPNFPDADTVHIASSDIDLSGNTSFEDGTQFLNALTNIGSSQSAPKASATADTKAAADGGRAAPLTIKTDAVGDSDGAAAAAAFMMFGDVKSPMGFDVKSPMGFDTKSPMGFDTKSPMGFDTSLSPW